jgi:hypothetical protein
MKRTILVFSMVLLAAALLLSGQSITYADQHETPTHRGYDGPDEVSICLHTDWDWTAYDTWVGLGISAIYDTNHPPANPPVAYNSGLWYFERGVGGQGSNTTYWFYGSLHCYYVIGGSGTMHYDSADPAWETHNGNTAWYHDWNHSTSFSDVSSLNGETYSGFYDTDNPGNIWYLAVYPTNTTTLTATPYY